MSERLPVTGLELLTLAQSPDAGERGRLLLHLGDLCAAKPWSGAETSKTANDVMLALTRKAELAVRAELAIRLADTPWAPRDLIIMLAYDEIEVADPVLAGSPVLTEEDLVKIAESLGEAHRRSLARRPGLVERVGEKLARQGEIRVLPILLGNRTARLNAAAMKSCAEAASRDPGLWDAIIERPDLTAEIAALAYERAGEAVRDAVLSRFPEAREAFEDRYEGGDSSGVHAGAAPDARDLAVQLVDKLEASDKLTCGFVMKCLAQGKMELFEIALARRSGVERDVFSAAIQRRRSVALALACKAAGLDRSVFPSVHARLLRAGRLREALEEPVLGECASIFREMTQASAAKALRRIGSDA